MRELLDLIPFLDVAIVVLIFFFLYLGWSHGMPRLLMVVGSIYTGFLLASVYYHLFAVSLISMFKIRSGFIADLISFIVLDVLITILMLALLLSLFGHVKVKGRAIVFDKVLGSVIGLFAAVLIAGIFVTILRIPYEASAQGSSKAVADMPIVQFFNGGYEKSTLAPNLLKGAPYFLASVTPLLPPETRAKGAVPLLESIVATNNASK